MPTPKAKRRLTIDLEPTRLEEIEHAAARQGASVPDFIERALARAIGDAARQQVDAEFAGMADDGDYRADMQRLDQELSPASEAAWSHLPEYEPRSAGGR